MADNILKIKTDIMIMEEVPAPVFRKSIRLEEGEKSGEILICGLGFYELFVNGKKITKGVSGSFDNTYKE